MWTFTVESGKNIPAIPENITATITYKIENKSRKPKVLALYPTPDIVQTNTCRLAPKNSSGDSCSVTFKIIGSKLPIAEIHKGPILCQANSDGTADPNQCYQPDKNNSLSITKTKKLADWNNWGQNKQNSHHNINSGITKDNVKEIAELCKIDYTQGLAHTPSNSSAFSNSDKPVIVNDTIYWTGFAGVIGAHQIQRDGNGNFIGCNPLWVYLSEFDKNEKLIINGIYCQYTPPV
ncbi:hypothetical protein [Legionella sainthelensi]|uniref:hypothetical protein n=1 Tax=Legionella sainthelensi TaxID=28087 RepID=UPI000ACF8392|nr:hypothetical protein [Legionella sainthelensi]